MHGECIANFHDGDRFAPRLFEKWVRLLNQSRDAGHRETRGSSRRLTRDP
jgi:hypothetical protein